MCVYSVIFCFLDLILRVEHKNRAMRICEARKSYDFSVHGKFFNLDLSQKNFTALMLEWVSQPQGWSSKIVPYISEKHLNRTIFLFMDRAIFFIYPSLSQNSFTMTRGCFPAADSKH